MLERPSLFKTVNLFFLGYGAVGKSSLVVAIKTRAAGLGRWFKSVPDPGLTPMVSLELGVLINDRLFNIIDVGGQVCMFMCV